MLVTAVAAFATVLAACGDDDEEAAGGGGETAAGAELEDNEVTFALGFAQNYGQAPFFAALEAGYYDEAGLEVDFVVPDSTQTAAKLVGVGRADAGEFFGLDPITAAAEGIPTRVAATWAWGDLGLMALPDGNVSEVEDLGGERVGVFEGLPYGEACRPRLLEDQGLSSDDVETVDVGFNSITPLLSGKVAASEGGDPVETVTVEIEEGQEPTFFPYGEVCPPFLFGVFVNSDWAQENPEAASRFIEATMRGAKLASEEPEEVHRLFTERFPDLEQPVRQFREFGEAICGPEAPERGLGYVDRDVYEELIQLAQEEDLLEEELSYEDVVTEDYLPEDPVLSDACS